MMPFFEARYALNPLLANGGGDPDGDTLSNLEEFLRGSSPREMHAPDRVFFVSPNGQDIVNGGDSLTPWATINFALATARDFTTAPIRIVLAPGTYFETVTLAEKVTLCSDRASGAAINGTVFGAEDAALENLTLLADAEDSVLLDLLGSQMRLSGATFRGTPARQAIGCVTNDLPPGKVLFDGCTFVQLGTGIRIEAQIPVVRRCVFDDIAQGAISLAPGAFAKSLGDAQDPGSGFNTFLASVDAPVIVNESGATIKLENNDWDTEDPEAIAALMDSPVDFEPFLAKGSGLLAAALFCTVFDAANSLPVPGATVLLAPQNLVALAEEEASLYSFPVLGEGSYTLHVSAPEHDAESRDVALIATELLSITVPLQPTGEGEGEGEPPRCACRTARDRQQADPGDLAAAALLVAGVLAFARRRAE